MFKALGKSLDSATPQTIQRALQSYGTCKTHVLAQNIVDALEYDVSAIPVLEKLGITCQVCLM
jgi:hypothetical protein